VSYKAKLTSGNEADRNQSAMSGVAVKTATERDKNPSPLPRKANFCEVHANTENKVADDREGVTEDLI